MCNLITNKATVDEVGAAMKARRKKKTNAGTGEVWKGGTGFVVRDDGGERVLEAMTWGFPRHSVNQRTGKPDRKSVVKGKSVSVRVDLGGRRNHKKKKHNI